MLQALLAFLEERVDPMVQDTVVEASRRWDHYRQASDIEQGNVRQTVRAILNVILQVLRGQEVDPKGLDAMLAALGERRARQGYPLAELVGMFQVTREVMYRHVQEALRANPDIGAGHLAEFDLNLCRLFNRMDVGVITPYLEFQEHIIQAQQSFLKHKFSSLFKLVEAISNNLNIDEFCKILLDYLCRFYDLKVAGVFVLDEGGRELFPLQVTGLNRRFKNEERLSAAAAPIRRCLKEDEAVMVTDTPFAAADLTTPPHRSDPDSDDAGGRKRPPRSGDNAGTDRPRATSIYAPMTGRQRTYGVVSLHSYRLRRFTQTEVQQLETLARILAVALENARFYQNLIEEKGKLDAIVNSMSDGLILINFHEEIVFINEQAARYLQQPVHKLTGSSASIVPERLLQNAKDPHTIQPAYLRALTNIMENPVLEFTLYRPEITDIRLTMFPVRDREHHFIGRGLIIEDISHEKEVNRMKSEFVAIASHTMRTPMTSILGFASLLIERRLPSDTQEKYVQNIYRESQRLTGILNDMLDLANIEAGKISLKLMPVDLNEIAETVVQEFREETGRSIELMTAGKKIPRLIADRQKVRQAIANLIQNALQYSKNKVVVRLARMEEPKFLLGWNRSRVNLGDPGFFPALAVSVKDTGEGIPPDQLDAIFEPFHRITTDPARFREGSGLGLTIVRYIVQAHGGTIWAESLPGKGSLFTFLLPLDLVHPERPLNRSLAS